ncbi:MAG: hypothetical protein AB1349_01575 [Elusimicrobiota bacterium]
MIPQRMNLVKVKLLLLARKGREVSTNIQTPVLDKDFSEPKGAKVYGSNQGRNIPLEASAQVDYRRTEQRTRTSTGEVPESNGHLVFKSDTFDSLSDKPKRGDRIVEIAGRPVDYKIIEIRPQAHLRGIAHLVFVYFQHTQEGLT